MNSLDVILWVLASPILLMRWLFRVRRRWKFWVMAYTPRIVCGNCRGAIWLVGLWRCGCGFTYRGHVARVCPVCGSLPRMVRCFNCGVTTKLPEP
jgi:hypothetical protein